MAGAHLFNRLYIFLACLPVLNTLNISHNKLQTAEDIAELTNCPNLSILDISHNRIDDPNAIDVLMNMKNLRVLTLTGNPLIQDIKFYRKTMTVKLKNLQYLDDRPVFPKDRACAEAWAIGGLEAEKAERDRWASKEHAKMMESVDSLLKMRKSTMAKKIETHINKKRSPEERVEVEVDSVDWLYGTYKIKGDGQVYQFNEEDLLDKKYDEGNDNVTAVESKDPSSMSETNHEELEMISSKRNAPFEKEEESGIFSNKTNKSTRLVITPLEDEVTDQNDLEGLPDLEEIDANNVKSAAADLEIDKPYRPIIEVIDKEDEIEDIVIGANTNKLECSESLLSGSTGSFSSDRAIFTKPKNVLIEDITVSISDESDKARDVPEDCKNGNNLTDTREGDLQARIGKVSLRSTSETLLTEQNYRQAKNNRILIEEIDTSEENIKNQVGKCDQEMSATSDTVDTRSCDEQVETGPSDATANVPDQTVARPCDKTSEELLKTLGVFSDSNITKDGILSNPSIPSHTNNDDDNDEDYQSRPVDEELEGLD
ncbi:hypothetical protein Btru_043511 [Bulinus truncatus]|nr:hypothetical protein Btru_043511 [Bulinus truncatus]